MPELQNLKAGNQGTNFQATQEQYEALLGMLGTNSSDAYYAVKQTLDPEKLGSFFQILRNFQKTSTVLGRQPLLKVKKPLPTQIYYKIITENNFLFAQDYSKGSGFVHIGVLLSFRLI